MLFRDGFIAAAESYYPDQCVPMFLPVVACKVAQQSPEDVSLVAIVLLQNTYKVNHKRHHGTYGLVTCALGRIVHHLRGMAKRFVVMCESYGIVL
jgi:hypothetical protein